MARNPWPGQAASVIVLPSGKRGETLLAMAQSWSQSGILGQALWVLPQDNLAQSHGLSIEAQIFGKENTVSVDLFQQLAQNPLSMLRIIAIRLLVDKTDIDETQDEVVAALDKLANVGVPVVVGAAGGTSASGTDILRINMIMAPSWVDEVKHRSITEKRWTHNVIISPEDRTSPWGIDAFVREETNLYGITLANIASAGGLWMGVPRGSFEFSSHNRSGIPGQIWLQRSFARGVLTEGLATEQAVKAMDSAGNPDSNNLRPEYGLQPSGIALLPDAKIQETIAWMVDRIFEFEDSALAFHPFVRGVETKKVSWGLGKQLVEFLKFAWDKTKMIPIWTFDAIVGWVSRKFTKIFQGADGNADVDGRIDFKRPLDDADREIENSVFDLDRIKNEALNPKKSVETSSFVRATPRLWEQQRTLLFSALDGSQGPAGVEMPKKEDRQLIFGRLYDLLFDASDDWHLQGGIATPEGFDSDFIRDHNVVDWENLLSAETLLIQTQAEIARVKTELAASKKAEAAEAEIAKKSTEAATATVTSTVPEQQKAPEVDLMQSEMAQTENSPELEESPQESEEGASDEQK